jgi:hypothetical protein
MERMIKLEAAEEKESTFSVVMTTAEVVFCVLLALGFTVLWMMV